MPPGTSTGSFSWETVNDNLQRVQSNLSNMGSNDHVEQKSFQTLYEVVQTLSNRFQQIEQELQQRGHISS